MSQYASRADLVSTGLPARALEELDGGKQDEFLVGASGMIDTYLRGRYRLPITGTLEPNTYPSELKDACVAIAGWRIIAFRGSGEGDELFRERHDFYLGSAERGTKGWLDKLSAGAVSIDAALDASPSVHEGGGYVVDGSTRGFADFQGNGIGEPIGSFWSCPKPD